MKISINKSHFYHDPVVNVINELYRKLLAREPLGLIQHAGTLSN